MRRHWSQTALAGLILAFSGAWAQQPLPGVWLQKMGEAVQATNYEGTVIRLRDGKVEALKVVHVVADGVIREKVVVQEGNGLEIIRNGNEVQCILPDRRSVLVEEWDDQSTLFSTLPSSDIRFGSEYDVAIVREERVAGRKAVLIAIRPHDEYRFGHRIWLDVETAFPLQTKLIGSDGEAIEQVKFADITLNGTISASALMPSYSTEDFRWFNSPGRSALPISSASWQSDDLPPGFREVSSHDVELQGSDGPVLHIVYSDGLANVSVFIEQADSDAANQSSKLGASKSFSTTHDGFQITAVGEVPVATVERIAASMRPADAEDSP